ncbi:MAG: putative DNA binding domain-containing protein [Leptospirales bacterium]|nr:putative DNA binding domain-containing protein [Leptospirales bacterium]
MDKIALIKLALEISENRYETQNLEVKSAKIDCPKRLYDTLSSFSNQDSGGTILFGIDEENDFAIVGVYNAHDLQKRISEQCEQMEPICRPLFTVAEIEGKTIVSAEVPSIDFAERPCFYKGKGVTKGSYIRVGDSDSPMTSYEVYRYEAYRKQARDDLRILENISLEQLNTQKITKFLELAKTDKANLSNVEDKKVLELLGIIHNGRATLTGWILFNDYPQSIFPQFGITAVVVPGTQMGETNTQGVRFIDNKRFDGDFQTILDGTEKFIIRNMQNNTIINDEGKRADKYEYPIRAIREILLNALMHRDYSVFSESMPVAVEMYRDRLEITNPGGLYGRINISDLGKTKTEVRNVTLVNALEILGVAENRHSGIPTIRLEMEKNNLPLPVFKDCRGEFKVILYNHFNDIQEFCQKPRSRLEIAEFLKCTPDYAMANKIVPLLEEGKLAMTMPHKPKSKLQKYYSLVL